jgi:hypothetical protein
MSAEENLSFLSKELGLVNVLIAILAKLSAIFRRIVETSMLESRAGGERCGRSSGNLDNNTLALQDL